MKIVAYTLLILSGLFFDLYSAAAGISIAEWQDIYSTVRDLQFIGFALLAFALCPYSKVEAKALTFFMVLWRIGVALINYFSIDPFYSPVLALFILIIYMAWVLRSLFMGEYNDRPEQPGAYHIFFPIHSYWGLLQSVFLPWHPARYESRMVSDGKNTWAISKKKFVKYENLNIDNLDHVKVYLGRKLTDCEISFFDVLVGQPATPGWNDCRKFLL